MAEKLQVISANRLRDGAVVYLGPADWVETFDQAEPFETPAALEAGLMRAKASERANVVLDIFPVEGISTGKGLRPIHIRELIRAAGPTVRRDHGKQAAATLAHADAKTR